MDAHEEVEVHVDDASSHEQQLSGGRKRQAPPVDLAIRKRAIELVLDEKWTQTDAARALGVNRATLSQIIKRFKKDPSSLGGSSRTPFALSSEHRARIRAWVDDDCGLVFQALQNKARAAFGFPVSVAAINLALRSLHFSVTRLSAPLPLPPDQLNSDEALQARYEYGLEYVRLFPKRHKLVFVGEAEFVFSVRTRPSANVKAVAPTESDEGLSAQFSVRAHQFSVTAALMDSRVLLHRVRFGGDLPALSFETLVTRVADALHNAGIQDAVIVLGAEYRAKFLQSPGIASSLGHSLLFLPPDSPSLMNPIESFYGDWNATVRRGSPPPVSEQELLRAIESCGATLSQEECAAYFRKAEAFMYPSILKEQLVD
ncbi:hypothetical protein Gpo141_00010013 [Globisporangium polare]